MISMATYTRESLEKEKVAGLRVILQNLGRRKAGTKPVLIDRILDAQNVTDHGIKENKGDVVDTFNPGSVLRDISKSVHNSSKAQSSWSDIDRCLKNKTLKWDDKIENVPKLSLGWVTNYLTEEYTKHEVALLDEKEPDWAELHRRVLDRADKLFCAGKVSRVLCSISEEDGMVNVKCTCGASMKQQTYTILLRFHHRKNPDIATAHCTCLAGLSQRCGHIGALLLALLECQKKGYSSMACTSRDPSWPAPASKKTEPCKVSELVIEKKSVSKSASRVKEISVAKFHAARRTEQTITDRQNFALEYSTIVPDCTFVRYSRSVNENIEPFLDISCVDDINVVNEEEVNTSANIPHPKLPVCDNHVNTDCDCKSELVGISEKVVVDFSQAHEIEKLTRTQSECSRWKDERKLRLTSSNFGKIIKRKKNIDSDFLLTLYTPKELEKIKSIQFGREHECDAADALMQHIYEEYCDRNIVMYHCGLVINPNMSFLGASPDRILYIEGEGFFVVELKSSIKSENLKKCPTELANTTNYCLTTDEDDVVVLSRQHDYYYQVLGQMAICNLKRAFFVVWSSYGCHIEEIEFDRITWDECYDKLSSFYKEYYRNYVDSQQ